MIGHAIRYLQGEEDALMALAQSAGIAVRKAWPPRIEGPIEPKKEGEDFATPIIENLHAKGLLKMGPPSSTITIKGVQYKLDKHEWARYVSESSDIVHAKIQKQVENGTWEKFDEEKQAARIKKMISDARKKVLHRMKREIKTSERSEKEE